MTQVLVNQGDENTVVFFLTYRNSTPITPAHFRHRGQNIKYKSKCGRLSISKVSIDNSMIFVCDDGTRI